MELEKITGRSYADACGLAHALELIGERWAPLVLRELLLGPRRFSELRAALPGISANVLTQRLGDLEARRLVERRTLPPPASVQVYQATEWALEASPILCALGRWASRSPLHERTHPVSAVAIMLSMQTNVDVERIGDFAGTLAFSFPDGDYFARVEAGKLEIGVGEPAQADAVVSANPNALKPVLYGGAPVDQLEIAGDRAAARRFFSLFSLPPTISAD